MGSERFNLRSERGFSLAEVVVSVGLLSVAAVGTAHMLVLVAVANLTAKSQTSANLLAVQKMEQLRSLAWGFEEEAGGNIGDEITDLTTNLTVDPPAPGGSGLGLSPANTLSQNTAGYVDYLNAQGSWIGTGATPPAGTVYIRRWSIEASPSGANTLILQVMVTTLRREVRRKSTASPGTMDDDARIVSVKTRRAL